MGHAMAIRHYNSPKRPGGERFPRPGGKVFNSVPGRGITIETFVERYIPTVWQEWLNQHLFDSIAELQEYATRE